MSAAVTVMSNWWNVSLEVKIIPFLRVDLQFIFHQIWISALWAEAVFLLSVIHLTYCFTAALQPKADTDPAIQRWNASLHRPRAGFGMVEGQIAVVGGWALTSEQAARGRTGLIE